MSEYCEEMAARIKARERENAKLKEDVARVRADMAEAEEKALEEWRKIEAERRIRVFWFFHKDVEYDPADPDIMVLPVDSNQSKYFADFVSKTGLDPNMYIRVTRSMLMQNEVRYHLAKAFQAGYAFFVESKKCPIGTGEGQFTIEFFRDSFVGGYVR